MAPFSLSLGSWHTKQKVISSVALGGDPVNMVDPSGGWSVSAILGVSRLGVVAVGALVGGLIGGSIGIANGSGKGFAEGAIIGAFAGLSASFLGSGGSAVLQPVVQAVVGVSNEVVKNQLAQMPVATPQPAGVSSTGVRETLNEGNSGENVKSANQDINKKNSKDKNLIKSERPNSVVISFPVKNLKGQVIGQVDLEYCREYINENVQQAGAEISCGYFDCGDNEFNNLNWVQSIVTNDPINGEPVNEPFFDPYKSKFSPYYYSPTEARLMRKVEKFYKIKFDDAARRPALSKNVQWCATLLLVNMSLDTKSYSIIAIFNYGFQIINGITTVFNFYQIK